MDAAQAAGLRARRGFAAPHGTVGEVTVALISLELFGEGIGVLRYRISYEEGMFEGGYRIPEPELVIRDGSGRVLS